MNIANDDTKCVAIPTAAFEKLCRYLYTQPYSEVALIIGELDKGKLVTINDDDIHQPAPPESDSLPEPYPTPKKLK